MATTHYLLNVDTETCNINKSDKVIPGNNLTYDIGFALIKPSTGEIIFKRSYIVREIFFGEWTRMQSSYYAHKLPIYYRDIAEGRREIRSFFEIMNEIAAICREYNVVAFVAHNARFDVDALNTTARWLTGLYSVRALPDSLEVWDSIKMWRATMPKSYEKFCMDNEYMTRHTPPRVRMTAEIIYRFINNEPEFIESHTALEDVLIESEIIFAAYRSHKKMAAERVLYHARA